jgi:hypothetical protein
LVDVFDGPLEYRALVLVAVRHKTSNLVDALINGFTTSAFN